MSKSDTFESDWLKLIFNATPIAGLADNAATTPNTVLYLSLHTADPGETGDQSTNEVNYVGFARKSVARTTGGFAVSGTAPAQAATVTDNDFPPCGADQTGAQIATFFSVGVGASGATKRLYSGSVSPPIVFNNGVTPRLSAGTKCTED